MLVRDAWGRRLGSLPIYLRLLSALIAAGVVTLPPAALTTIVVLAFGRGKGALGEYGPAFSAISQLFMAVALLVEAAASPLLFKMWRGRDPLGAFVRVGIVLGTLAGLGTFLALGGLGMPGLSLVGAILIFVAVGALTGTLSAIAFGVVALASLG